MNMLSYKNKTVVMKAARRIKFFMSPKRRILIENDDTFDQGYSPIFIVGCFRSGTSLLRRIIDSHSQIACPAESKFLCHSLRMIEDQRSMKSLEYMGFSRKDTISMTRRYIENYFRIYARANKKIYWADKTPNNVDYINTLDELFEYRAKMIFIYRHGLDVANSLHVRSFPEVIEFLTKNNFNSKFVGCAVFWANQVLKMLESDAARTGRAYQIKYENLVAEPVKVLKGIFEYLKLNYEDDIVNYHNFHHDKGFEDAVVGMRREIKPSVKNYQGIPDEIIACSMEHIGSLMKRLGYEV